MSLEQVLDKEPFFNANTKQVFAFDVIEGGQKYETAHHYEPLSDERYIEFLNAMNLHGTEDDVQSEDMEASESLWNDLVTKVDNIEYDESEDWKSLIDIKEKTDSLDRFLAVLIVEPEATGKPRVLKSSETQIFYTEALFNNLPTKQKHVLKKKNIEQQKKYDRLQSKRFKQDAVKGLSKTKNHYRYIPQDEKIGKIYDEMFLSNEGFEGGVTPLRFKTAVIHYIFASPIDVKK